MLPIFPSLKVELTMENNTRSEKLDMLLIFAECRQNAEQTTTVYAKRFPVQRHLRGILIRNWFEKCEIGENNNFIVIEDKEIDF